jgi:DNA-binding phage protein
MKNVKALTSISYRDDLIRRLQDPAYAALYLETHLEEPEPEPELIHLALSQVCEALSQQKMTPDEAIQHRQKLNDLMAQPGDRAIHDLANWLEALGLKLTVVQNPTQANPL